MTQPIETRMEPHRERNVHGWHPAPDRERDGLQLLVGELLSENQRLRFENAGLRAQAEQLEQENESAKGALAGATKWAGMVL